MFRNLRFCREGVRGPGQWSCSRRRGPVRGGLFRPGIDRFNVGERLGVGWRERPGAVARISLARVNVTTAARMSGGAILLSVGREALVLVEEFCRKLGLRAVELQADNSRAARFYQRFGFHAFDRVLMSKRLD